MAKRGSGKVKNSLVAASSAAILTVYAAGYARTKAAAARMEAQSSERRPAAQPRIPYAAEPAQQVAIPAASPKPEPAAQKEADAVPSTRSAMSTQPGVRASAAPPAIVRPAPLPADAPPSVEHKVEPAKVEQAPASTATVVSAPVVAPAAPAAPAPPATKWKDGTYTGWGTSRHGDIQASVVIEGGRIKEATIAQCLTRYSCDIIDKLPPQVAQRQSPETDFVSGATQSTNAFYYGVVEALGKASDAAKADAAKTN